jgi:hypothetical protein
MEGHKGPLHELAYIPIDLGVAQEAPEAQGTGPPDPLDLSLQAPRSLGPWASWAFQCHVLG